MGGEQISRQPSGRESDEKIDKDIPVVEPDVPLSEIDKMLDEIDGVLEENAEEFVKSYQQRGGQ